MSQQGLLPGPPTQAGFLQFLRGVVGIPTNVLPDDAVVIGYAYGSAFATVNQFLACSPPSGTYAVYNLGADLVIQFAPDAQPPVVYMDGLPYFAYMRKQFGLNSFVGGVVNSTSDEGTSESLTVPDWATGLTIDQLGELRTPWGRQYLSIAMKFGTLWGLT